MALQIGKRIHESPILSVPNGEPTTKVATDVLLSVEHLEVIAPSDRHENCPIYGYVRVSDEQMDAATAVSLFNREREEPETIDLGHHRFLTLSDDASVRPVYGGTGFHVQIKLWEKIGDDFNKDRVIVEVDFEFDGFYKTNKRSFLEFNGDFGFNFSMAYALIYGGVSANVQFTFMKDIACSEESTTATGKRKEPISSTLIYGTIGATQGISMTETTAIELFHAPFSHPMHIEIESPIELRRKQVVALTGGGCLGIAYTFYDATDGRLITSDAVPFRILREDGYVTAPEHMTYTQESDDGLVSVTITLVPYKYPPRLEDE